MAPLLLLLAVASASPDLALVDEVTGPAGCARRLVGSADHPFVEAQIACDTFLALALVGEALDGRLPVAQAVPAVRRLLADAQGRGAAPFAKSPKSVLRRGYELLLYTGLARLGGLSSDEGLAYDRLAREIASDVDAASPAFVESFRKQYWPCDSAPAAAALLLHGALRNDPLTRGSGEKLVRRLEALRSTPAGFVTRVDGAGRPIEPTPRGTVMAWTAGFLALAAVPEARAFADDLFTRFCGRDVRIAGLVAPASCREWPRGMDRKADAVSGPILEGQGTGASALAIAALRATGRTEDADRLTRLSELAGPALALLGRPVKQGPLERSILRWGAAARSWAPEAAPDVRRGADIPKQ